MRELIGVFFIARKNMHDRFLPDKKDDCYSVEVYRNKEVGVKVDIIPVEQSIKKFCKGFGKCIKNKNLDGKRVDTSKWVHPDRESIKNELIKQIVACLLLKEESESYKLHQAKLDTINSILDSHSPRNPQSLTNFYIPNLMSKLQSVCKTKHCSYEYKILFGRNGKQQHYRDMDRCREKIGEYREKLEKKLFPFCVEDEQ